MKMFYRIFRQIKWAAILVITILISFGAGSLHAQAFTEISAGLIAVDRCVIDWGDYDNDGDLDILLSGASGTGVSRIYRNDAGTFTNISAALDSCYYSAGAWGDYDNDGDLDILLTGYNGTARISKIYQNNSGIFTDISAGLVGVYESAVAWGDYDNDGDLDVLLAGSDGGTYYSRVYRNDDGAFTDIAAGLPGVVFPALAWGDYDNDGDIDILLTGQDVGATRISKIYQNNNGTFSDIAAGLTGVWFGSVAWGDYDQDGDPDILLTGGDAADNRITKMYRNDGGIFTDISTGLPGIAESSVTWGDYDNDGDPDILMTGSDGAALATVYRNDNETFTDIAAGLTGCKESSAAWGDYDNDGDLDIVYAGDMNSGNYIAKLYRNNIGTANTPPAAPSVLISMPAVNSVILRWNRSTDSQTSLSGLTYNLRVGTSPGGSEIVSPMANSSNGYRRIVRIGNTEHDSTWTINNLPEGIYYWSVQAIDNAFTGSAFATEQIFSIIEPRTRDSLSLVTLYDSTGGDSWTNKTNWKSANPIDTWFGVNVSGGRINSLDLTFNNLVGNLPSAIGNLSALQYLKLGSNGISGFIRNEIGNLTNLRELYIHANQFSGPIPPSIGNLSNLRILYLQLNYLTGSIPPEIGNLSQVQLITVSGNNLSGSIPAALGSLPNLTALYLNGNQFSGSIPASLGNLSGLQYLTLSNNQLTGSVPAELGALTQLQWLWLASNQLSGTIPVQIGNLTSVTQLYLHHNELSGNVPDLSSLTSLQELRLNSNQLTGLDDLNSLATLSDLSVENNKLTFADIEPNIGAPSSTFTYSPQDSVGAYKDTVVLGETAFQLSISVGGTSNQYQWYLNGNLIGGATSSTYSILSAVYADSGMYHCQITNTVATSLTLFSRTFKVHVDPPLFEDMAAGLPGLYLSSVAWGDYDNDNDRDLILTGYDGTNRYTYLYKNDAGSFVNQSVGLGQVFRDGTASWGDYDNDGDLDLLLTGGFNAKIYRNDNGSFTDIGANIYSGDAQHCSSAWGDYDNDGDLDFVMTGSTGTRIYRNDAGVFSDISAGLASSFEGAAAWGDYDNDGDMDIVLSGGLNGSEITKIYRNDAGIFTDINATISGITNGALAWGDYDADGDLDLIVAGQNGNPINMISTIYRNDAGSFTDINAGFSVSDDGSAAFGDYDNDGDLDVLITGSLNTNIFRNDAGTFTSITHSIPGVRSSSAQWGDFDNDGDLDIAISGEYASGYVSRIYRNNTPSLNSVPAVPAGMSSSLSGNAVTLQWLKSADAQTPQDGLTYNLRVGTTPGGSEIVSPMANNADGYRKVTQIGNAGHKNSRTIKNLPQDMYYWSVQAIDNGFSGSGFAPEQSFSYVDYRQRDSLALVDLYDSTGGSGWTNNTNWKSANPIDTWHGLAIAGGRVDSIALENNNLNGSIPSSIGNMTQLRTFQVDHNQLSGSIPIQIGNLTSLVHLALQNNQLSGSIPSEIGNLTQLVNLYLNANQLSGNIPSQIGNLTVLDQLHLDHNQLSGGVPELNNLNVVRGILLSDNLLAGLSDLSSLASLEHLWVFNNNLTFEDIEPNIGGPNISFTYSPQDSVGTYKDTAIVVGASNSFSVTVGGANNQYQWYKNGSIIDGATSATYTIPSASSADAGTYHCQITNSVATELTLYSRTFKFRVALSSDLVAYYPFNANMNDESGYGNNGTNNGAAQTTDRFGNINNAYYFNGSSYIDCGDPIDNSLDLTGDFTISSWIQLTDFSSRDCNSILSKDEGGGNNYKWIFGYTTNASEQSALFHAINVNSSNNSTSYSNQLFLGLSQWYHLTLTSQSNTLTFYLNGIARGSMPLGFSVPDANASLKIGMAENGFWFNGKLDDISVYNRALTVNEIDSLYHVGGWTGPPPTITSFSPTSGPIGTAVTISGTNFNSTTSNNVVYFGAVKANVTNATSTELTVTVPVSSTYAPITVTDTTTGLTAYSNAPFGVTFSSSRVIDSTSFAGKVDFTTGTQPASVAIGDIDGDGKPDLATANNLSNNISVVRNTSASGSITAGSFATKVDFTSGTTPWGTVFGDLDGDGKLDLIVVNQFNNTISVFRNISSTGSITTGSFGASVDFTTGSNQGQVALGDMDGDGKPDLAVTNVTGATISVFRNTSTSGSITSGSFAERVDFTTGLSPAGVAVGDIDGDLKPDLVVANASSNTVSVLRNTSTSGSVTGGSFTSKVDFTTGEHPQFVVIGDVDGDGKQDISVVNAYHFTVSVIRNISTSGSITTASFADKVDFTTGTNPQGIALGDIDGDGKPELAVTYGSTVSIFKNTSTAGLIAAGSFANKVDFTTGSSANGVSIGDIDGDGKPDLAVANKNSNSVSVLRNTIPSGRDLDSLALVALYDSTGGDTWNNNTNWKTSNPIDTWYGVTVSNDRVVQLSMDQNNLSGNLPGSIGDMTQITNLHLTGNNLTGTIPASIGNLSLLQNLYLSSNQLTGTLPASMSNLTQLKDLYLRNNQLSGSIPAFIGSLDQVGHLYLSSNQFSGSIPDEIGGMSSLTELNIDNNLLTGQIPAALGNLSQLQGLELTSNQLSGSIPQEIGNLIQLRWLVLNQNQLSGSIPAQIGNLTQLLVFRVDNNQISGTIPAVIGNLTALTHLYVSQNLLTGDVPDLSNLINLGDLRLSGNQFTGLPNLSSLTVLNQLYIENNKLTFEDIEPQFGKSFSTFTYSPQDSVGEYKDTTVETGSYNSFPLSVGGASNDYKWYKNGSQISNASATCVIPSVTFDDSGTYHCMITNDVATALTLYSRTYKLHVIPSARTLDSLALIALYDSTGGAGWTNSTNWKTSNPIDTWYGVTVSGGRVTELSLATNNVAGIMPASIGDLTNLQSLVLSNNQLMGSIPFGICSLYNLQYLHLGNNQFSGSIPSEIGNLTQLLYLHLLNNQLSGSIPPEIGNLSQLMSLDFQINNLSGSIPLEIGNFSNLTRLDLRFNALSGTIPNQIGNLSNLQYLYLRHNSLTGSIPASLSNASNLKVIALGDNQLSGSIPSELGNLTMLETLNIPRNKLSGAVPSSLSVLPYLYQLRLTNNRLTDLPDLTMLDSLKELMIDSNKFTFEDIEPNIGAPSDTFSYTPQDSVGAYKDTTLIENQNLTLSVIVGGTQNQYQWFMNGSLVSGATSSSYAMNPVIEGTYHCRIANTLATQLTLYSRTVSVTTLKKPDVTTTSASNFTSSSATLGGLVDAKGISTIVQFQYGLTVSLGQTVTAAGSPISQSGSVNVNGSVAGLAAGTTYYYRVTATNAAGTSYGATAQFTTLDVAPQIQTGTVAVNPSSPSENQKITVSCTATGTNLSAKLFYGKASQITPDSVTMDWIGGTYSDSIPHGMVTFEGVWYRIRVSNSVGASYYPSATGRQNITVNIASTGPVTTISTYPDGIDKAQWFTVALSMNGNLDLSDAAVFGPQEKQGLVPTNWRALKYDAPAGFTDVTVLNGNEAYLLFQRKGDGQDIFSKISSPKSNDASLFNNISLDSGWNLIPWPYTFTADLGFHDTNHDTISRKFYQMKGDLGWTPDARMKPYSGFLIYNKKAFNIPIGSVIYWTRVTSKPLAAEDEWNIEFEAKSGRMRDGYNQLGVGPSTLSEPEPLNVPPFLSLAFMSNEGRKLSSDYTEEFTDGRIWNMMFDNQSGQSKAQLAWMIDRVPQELEAVLVDVSNNKFVDIRSAANYEFISRKDHHFRVIVGKDEFVAGEVNKLKQELPDAFDLAQNYPNPFNPVTTIKFDVAYASFVRIKIYNLLGQEVAVLVNRYYETGRYAAEWNGRDNLGRQVASGVYIYRLEAGKVSKTKKLLLVK